MAVRRNAAVVGQVLELRVTFLVDGAPFDPAELRKVQIVNALTGEVLKTVGAADIDRIELGVFKVEVGPFANAVTLYDRWYVTAFDGGEEAVKSFRTEVLEQAAVGDYPINRAWLIANFLFGIDLTDGDGNPFPDSMFELAIGHAFGLASIELGIDILPTDYVGANAERHDFNARDQRPYAMFTLDHRPIREIVSCKAYYPGNDEPIVDFPVTWLQTTIPEAGRVEIVPAVGSVPNIIGQAVPLIHTRWGGFFPGMYHWEYRTGFPAGQIPQELLYFVGLASSLLFLNIAGDLVAGAGLASKSISIGGLSQSLSTTNSATNAGYGARLGLWNKEIKSLEQRLRGKYHGPRIAVI